MANEILTVTYADVPGFDPSTVVDHIHVAITDSTGAVTPQDVAPGTLSATFANVNVDTYTFSVQGFDAAGNALSSAVTGTFTVTAPATITLSLPSAVTAAQA